MISPACTRHYRYVTDALHRSDAVHPGDTTMLLDIITFVYCIVPLAGMILGLAALAREEQFSRVIADAFPKR